MAKKICAIAAIVCGALVATTTPVFGIPVIVLAGAGIILAGVAVLL